MPGKKRTTNTRLQKGNWEERKRKRKRKEEEEEEDEGKMFWILKKPKFTTNFFSNVINNNILYKGEGTQVFFFFS